MEKGSMTHLAFFNKSQTLFKRG